MIKQIINICKMKQEKLSKFLPLVLNDYYKKIEVTSDYIYAEGDIPVLLVAHLDTVHKETPNNIWLSLDNKKIKADEGIGGDDRCGVYAILSIIGKLKNNRPYILFTTEEERGAIGAEIFCKVHDSIPINCIIELDRRGKNDVVRYDDDNDKLVKIFEGLGYHEEYGSFTDISVLCPHFKVSGVNLSCGYYNAHTTNEYIDLEELQWTINKTLKFLKTPDYY